MALADVIEDVEGQQKTLTVFNPPADSTIVTDLTEYFQSQNVAVTAQRTPTGRPTGFASLTRGDEFLTASPIEDLKELVETTPTADDGVGIDDSQYQDFLQYLKETTFTSYSKSQMAQSSYEIEDRAWRIGSGELHTGFQFTSIMAGQRSTYENLAAQEIDVHMYAAPDDTEFDIEDATLYLEDTEELRSSWFVVYDGGGEPQNKSALLAEEREPNSYFGFWTYDPGIVDRILEYLSATYNRVPH